jgi:hypothetical protein
MADPLFADALNEIDAIPFPAVATSPFGASGTDAGTTPVDAIEVGLVPAALVAVTVNVYVTPFVRPVTEMGDADEEATMSPGIARAV